MKTPLLVSFAVLVVFSPVRADVTYSIVKDTSIGDAEAIRGFWIYSGGYFYGTSQFSDGNLLGRIYRFDPVSNQFLNLHTFAGGTGGLQPNGLMEASNGILYGTALQGANNLGTLFLITKPGDTFATFYTFANLTGGQPTPGPPLEGSDNKLYGTVSQGGAFARGGIYRVQLDGGGYQLLRAFSGTGGISPGETPLGLIEGPGNLLYGTTAEGGTNGSGVLFSMEKDGDPYTVLFNFPSTGVRYPSNKLLLASDGYFYGATARLGFDPGRGIFRIAPDGSGYQVLAQFKTSDNYAIAKPLVEGSDGYLYGVSFYSSNDAGIVFRLPKNGTGFAILHEFGKSANDGTHPDSPLIEVSNGVFFGTASNGGTNSTGAIYRLAATLRNPTVSFGGKKKLRFRKRRLVLHGTAADDLGVSRVEYAVGSGSYLQAVGTTSWSATIRVKSHVKKLTLLARSFDNDGLTSNTVSILAKRKR